ncbi:hypothetical protein PC118_g20113 [Phytophthora cactorum]|uniref:Uncharacterized protein n=1 Tax=Phytophthora cactorum TaxID=29920 RepID=A0A8T1F560_9STRA|nr:hypothetical protein PC113_g6941 [Phytophthora cactorum]KAG2964802.1 hypothetical protein PC118_g20113 [Phytophthora cactorum]KAG3046328.1 hypothetical protein PC121_g20749 [Phytophthora cactorum]
MPLSNESPSRTRDSAAVSPFAGCNCNYGTCVLHNGSDDEAPTTRLLFSTSLACGSVGSLARVVAGNLPGASSARGWRVPAVQSAMTALRHYNETKIRSTTAS